MRFELIAGAINEHKENALTLLYSKYRKALEEARAYWSDKQ